MPTKEAGLVNAIKKEVLEEYPSAWVFKTVGNPYQMAGVPDLLLSVKGRLIGLEVKFQRPGESRQHTLSRVTAQQSEQIRRIITSGGMAAPVLSVEEALGVIETALGHDKESD